MSLRLKQATLEFEDGINKIAVVDKFKNERLREELLQYMISNAVRVFTALGERVSRGKYIELTRGFTPAYRGFPLWRAVWEYLEDEPQYRDYLDWAFWENVVQGIPEDMMIDTSVGDPTVLILFRIKEKS